jgi:leucyl aminopeptidase (aminopeptidase T)
MFDIKPSLKFGITCFTPSYCLLREVVVSRNNLSKSTLPKNVRSTKSDLEQKVARKVVSETLHLKKGDSVTVETWNNGFPLASKVVIEARKIGAHPIMIFEDEDTYVEGVRNMPKGSLGKMGKHEYELLTATDAYFFIPNEVLEGYTRRLSPDVVGKSTDYGSSWYEAAEKAKIRGARMSFGFAGKELGKILGKGVDKIVTEQLKATLVDYKAIQRTGKRLESELGAGTAGLLTSPGSELKFQFESGAARIEDGVVDEEDISNGYNMAYMPPGMLVKHVNPDSVTGKVKLSPTLTWRGVIDGAVLEFEKGRLVGWNSDKKGSKEKLDSMISEQAESERRMDELTIGLNPSLHYGYGQDRFVAGSLGISGLEFTGIVRSGTLRANQTVLIDEGKLRPS